jgi:hypothetical protein
MSRGKIAENKKKAPRVAAGPEAAPFARSMGENLGRMARAMLPLTLILSTVFGLSFLLWLPLQPNGALHNVLDLGVSEKSRLTAGALEQPILRMKRPEWISKEDFDDIAKQGLIATNHSVFEPNLSRTLMSCYSKSPWVQEVKAVHLQYPAQLSVELELRKPLARIDKSTTYVDREGVALSPSAGYDGAAVIAGVQNWTRVVPGARIPEKEIRDALGLLTVVSDVVGKLKFPLKVAMIQKEPANTWRVVTDRGPAIEWGYFTDEPPVDEPLTQDKAQLLRKKLTEAGDPRNLECIRVYTWQAPVVPRVADEGSKPVMIARHK